MGYSMGASIGGQFGCPDKTVVMFAGDGGFHMNLSELATMCSYNVPVKMFIMNNTVLGMVRQWQNFSTAIAFLIPIRTEKPISPQLPRLSALRDFALIQTMILMQFLKKHSSIRVLFSLIAESAPIQMYFR